MGFFSSLTSGLGFNRAKMLGVAEKCVQQGKLQQAIEAYEKIVENEPDDVNALNTIGDLYVRCNKLDAALSCFRKVAEAYAAQGFHLKAIAVYRKLQKLSLQRNPKSVDGVAELAQLYRAQGLNADARRQYMQLAEHHSARGDHKAAAGVLQEVLGLEGDNPALLSMLAGVRARLGETDKARELYMRAARVHLDAQQHEAARTEVQKLLQIDGANAEAIIFEAQIAAAAGQSDRVVHVLARLPDVETYPDALQVLLRARLKLGQAEEAAQAARSLALDHRDGQGVLACVPSLLERRAFAAAASLADETWDVLAEGQREVLLERLNGSLADLARDAAAGKPLENIYKRAGQSERLQQARRLVDEGAGQRPVPGASNDTGTAGPARTEPPVDPTPLVSTPPAVQVNVPAQVNVQKTPPAVQPEAAKVAVSLPGEWERLLALDDSGASGGPNSPAEDAGQAPGRPEGAAASLEAPEAGTVQAHEATNAEAVADGRAPAGDPPPGAATASVPAPAREEFEIRTVASHAAHDELPTFDLSLEWQELVQQTTTEDSKGPSAAEAQVEGPFSSASSAPAPVHRSEAPAGDATAPQDRTDDARSSHQPVAGSHAPSARSASGAVEPDLLGDLTAEVEQAFDALLGAALPAASTAPGVNAEASAPQGANEIPKPSGKGTPKPGAVPSDGAGRVAAAPSASEAAADKTLESPAPTPDAAQEHVGLTDIFDAFKSEIEGGPRQDLYTDYSHGIALFEMGLMDEAIGKLQRVCAEVERGQAFPHAIQAYTWLAHGLKEKGALRAAVRWYERALRVDRLDPEMEASIRYEIGAAYEAMGDRAAARQQYVEVYGLDIEYRDIGERMRACTA